MSRVNSALFFSFLLGASLCFLLGLSEIPSDLIANVRITWAIKDALIHFFDNVPVMVAAGMLFAWSFLLDRTTLRLDNSNRQPFWKLVQSPLILVLVLTIGYALVLAFAYGTINDQRAKLLNDSVLAQETLQRAREDLNAGRLETARSETRRAQALVPGWDDADRLYGTIIGEQNKNQKPTLDTPTPSTKPESNLTFKDLLSLMDKAEAEKDWFTALRYAEFAIETGNASEKQIAMERSNRIHQEIANFGPDEAEKTTSRIHAIKQSAIVDKYQNHDYLGAYYELLELKKIAPRDTDLRDWFPKVENALLRQVFFREEIEDSSGRTGTHPVFVKLPGTKETGPVFFYAGTMLQGKVSYYALDVELLQLSTDGNVLLHIQAPVAKLVPVPDDDHQGDTTGKPDQYLLLTKSVNKDINKLASEARIIEGTRNAYEANVYKIPVQGPALWTLSRTGTEFSTAGVEDLLWFLSVFPKVGRDVLPVEIEMLDRLFVVLSLVPAALLALALGWSNRSRYLNKPLIPGFFSVFFIPAGTYLTWHASAWLTHIILSSILVLAGFTVALVASLGLAAIFMLGTFFYTAGQSA